MPFPTHPLTRLTHPGTPHPSPIHALTFSSGTGAYLLTGSQDRAIRLWNPTTGRLIQTFSGAHSHGILDLAVSSDNARFVSGGGDKAVVVWDVGVGKVVRRFVGHAGRVEGVCFAGTSTGSGAEGGGAGGEGVVVSGSWDGTVRIWDLRGRGEKAVGVWGEAGDAVSSVAVTEGAGEGKVWAGSVDGRVRCYDLRAGVVETDVLGASVNCVVPTKGGGEYLAGTLDSKLRLMDGRDGRCLKTFGDGEYRNVEYRTRSTLGMAESVVIAGGEDGRVFVWDVLSGEVIERLWHKRGGGGAGEGTTKKDVVSAVAWNQLRRMWASAGGDGEVVVWGMGD